MYGNVIFDGIPAGYVVNLFGCGNAIERIYSFHLSHLLVFFISIARFHHTHKDADSPTILRSYDFVSISTRICLMFRSGASSVNAMMICTPLCSVRISGV